MLRRRKQVKRSQKMYRSSVTGELLVALNDTLFNKGDLLHLVGEMLEGSSEEEAKAFAKALLQKRSVLLNPEQQYGDLLGFIGRLTDGEYRLSGPMVPEKILESFTVLARVMDFHRKEQDEYTNGFLSCLSERMVDFWIVSASLPWAIKHGLPPDALIQCWNLISERLRRENTTRGWWPLANEEWQDADSGGTGSYYVGPYFRFEIPKICQFGLSDENYPNWRIANALEGQLHWLRDKLDNAIRADEGPWNPLPIGRRCCSGEHGPYRSVFRGDVVSSCHIGSPFREGVWERSRNRNLPSIDKDFEIKALKDAISDVNIRLTSLREEVEDEQANEWDLLDFNRHFLGCMSHNFRNMGI
jgi:hypothetical protein